MKGTPAIYLGRVVDKKNFRAFIHGVNGERRLVESWEEFEANMQSGLWFASVEDAVASKPPVEEEVVEEVEKARAKPKPRAKPAPKPKPAPIEVEEDADEVLADDDTVFEVTDDFLPKEGE